MRIGVPKEIKNNEFRVGLTPASVAELVAAGHELFVETKAGEGIDTIVTELAMVLGATFDRPADLDPVAELEEHLAVGWEYDADVVIDAPLEDVARRIPRVLGRLDAIDDGTTRLVGSTSNPIWYAEQLAAIPTSFRVVGGVALRECVADLAQRLASASF